MHVLKNESAPLVKNTHVFFDVFCDLLRTRGHTYVGIASAAPKGDIFSVRLFQMFGAHAAAIDLHGVDAVDARRDDIGEQPVDAAAAVQIGAEVRIISPHGAP